MKLQGGKGLKNHQFISVNQLNIKTKQNKSMKSLVSSLIIDATLVPAIPGLTLMLLEYCHRVVARCVHAWKDSSHSFSDIKK